MYLMLTGGPVFCHHKFFISYQLKLLFFPSFIKCLTKRCSYILNYNTEGTEV